MKRKPKATSKLPTLFDPCVISNEIHKALCRDFGQAQHVYCLNDSTTLYAFNRQAAELLKKYCSPGLNEDKLTLEAFEKFKATNEHMGRINETLTEKLVYTSPRVLASLSYEEKVHLRARAIMHFVLGHCEEEEWFQECKNSPGSSLGVSFANTTPEKKFSLPLSTTESAERMFWSYLSYDYMLKEAIFKMDGAKAHNGQWFDYVHSSRATTVDKSSTARRFIAVEPTCNMFLQQGLMEMMYRRMARVGLDVKSLPKMHRWLARVGSISGSLATIDWSSASDCVSPVLLEWLLPRDWDSAIHMVRTPNTVIDGEVHELNMISTMGNATTFPLETLVFWTYAVAIWMTLETDSNSLFPEWEDLKRCSVFGDDCILPTSIASAYVEFMESIGFIVNKEKSYYEDERFRESCGGDYLCGYDVRPYYLKAPHSTRRSSLEPWLYIITNALLKKYKQYFGELSYVYDKDLWRVLFALFRQHEIEIKLVPADYPDDAGLKISHDIERFQNHYPMKLSRIDKGEHGTYRFLYCKFRYRNKQIRDEFLQLALWMKHPSVSTVTIDLDRNGKVRLPEEDVLFAPIRRLGGYIVAKGTSCHWHVPTVKSAS